MLLREAAGTSGNGLNSFKVIVYYNQLSSLSATTFFSVVSMYGGSTETTQPPLVILEGRVFMQCLFRNMTQTLLLSSLEWSFGS